MNPSAPTTQPTTSEPKGLAIAALVLGIVAFLFGWLGFLNLVAAILAVVFGILALVKHQNKGLALTGLILGGLGLLTSILVGLFWGAAFLAGLSNAANNTSTNTTNHSTSTQSSWDVSAAYDKVTTGMTKAEVETATEKPSENCATSQVASDTYETCTYGDSLTDNGSISVSYVNNAVSSKSKFTN